MPHIELLASELVRQHGNRAAQFVVDDIQMAIRDGSIARREPDLRRLQNRIEAMISLDAKR